MDWIIRIRELKVFIVIEPCVSGRHEWNPHTHTHTPPLFPSSFSLLSYFFSQVTFYVSLHIPLSQSRKLDYKLKFDPENWTAKGSQRRRKADSGQARCRSTAWHLEEGRNYSLSPWPP